MTEAIVVVVVQTLLLMVLPFLVFLWIGGMFEKDEKPAQNKEPS
jgi:hypothetical protein